MGCAEFTEMPVAISVDATVQRVLAALIGVIR